MNCCSFRATSFVTSPHTNDVRRLVLACLIELPSLCHGSSVKRYHERLAKRLLCCSLRFPAIYFPIVIIRVVLDEINDFLEFECPGTPRINFQTLSAAPCSQLLQKLFVRVGLFNWTHDQQANGIFPVQLNDVRTYVRNTYKELDIPNRKSFATKVLQTCSS